MTGQVKEDILSRLAELGLEVADGALRFHGWRVPEVEFLSAPAPFAWVGLDGRLRRLDLAAGSLAFTFCQVPILLHRSAPVGITVVWGEGEEPASHPGLTLDAVTSAHLFQRDGVIQRLEVGLGRA